MNKSALNLLFAVSIASLSAGCSGSDSDNDVSRDLFNLGTTSNTESRNGLPFAGATEAEMQEFLDLDVGESRTVATTLLRVSGPSGTPDVGASEVTLRVTRTAEEDQIESFTLTLDYDGERLVMTGAELAELESPYIELPDGRFLTINGVRTGSESGVLQIEELDDDENTIGFSHFVAGLETNPDTLVTLGSSPETGNAIYSGSFIGAGTRMNADNTVIDGGALAGVYGDVEITASFEDMLVGGSIALVADESDVEYEISFEDVAIEGNGFSTTDTSTSCSGGATTCTGTVQLGGAFFGDQAQDVAGLVDFDLTSIGGEDGDERLVGGGGYAATVQPAP